MALTKGKEGPRPPGAERPIIICNRAPYEPVREGPPRRGAGGVVTALISLAEMLGADWVACARTATERELAKRHGREGVATGQRGHRIHYATPTSEQYRLYYSVIANPILWFTQHYLWDLGREPRITSDTHRAWNDGYVAVNRQMADAAAGVAGATERPMFMSHDYQLYLVPRLLRERFPDAVIEHFVHIPWPAAQYWKVLPTEMRDGIMEGLLGADLVGFQSDVDVRNFLICCEENLGLAVDWAKDRVRVGRRHVAARAYPISIDVESVARNARTRAVREEAERFVRPGEMRLIARVDRCDPSKNILRGFLAYAKLLMRHPEHRRKVQFLAFLQPSREEVASYRIYLNEIRNLVDHINAEFGDRDWRPIRLELGEGLRRALAVYTTFDVLLVNSTFDGMNLVVKEAIVTNEADGVVVLSENTGAAPELAPAVLTINPFDIEATADALHAALEMPAAERRRRLERGREILREHDMRRWVKRQHEDLVALRGDRRERKAAG